MMAVIQRLDLMIHTIFSGKIKAVKDVPNNN
jgi:hypothetical protein